MSELLIVYLEVAGDTAGLGIDLLAQNGFKWTVDVSSRQADVVRKVVFPILNPAQRTLVLTKDTRVGI